MAKHSTTRIKLNKKRVIRNILILLLILLIIFIIIKKNNKEYNYANTISIIINNDDITDKLNNEILIQDEVIYMSHEDIKNFIDKDIYIEPKTNMIITSSEKKVAALKENNRDIEINAANVTINATAFKTDEDILYIPISELKNVYDIDIEYIHEYNRVIIDYYSKSLVKAYTTKNISVKKEKNTFSLTIEKVKKANWVICIQNENDWTKVRTQNGNIGYIKTKKLTNFITEREEMKIEKKEIEEKYFEQKVKREEILTYNQRKKIINELLYKTITKQYKSVKIIYVGEQNEIWERFKTEARPIFQESGITTTFE